MQGNDGWGLLVLAGVDSFTRQGKQCYVSNRTIGEWCGVGVEAAKGMVSRLREMELLTSIVMQRGRRAKRYLHVPTDFSPPIYLLPNSEPDPKSKGTRLDEFDLL